MSDLADGVCTSPFPMEAFSAATLNVLGFGVVIMEADTHRIVYANERALHMGGYSLDNIIGKPCHKLLCPAEYGKCPITDQGQAVDNSERILLKADGESLAIIKTVVPVTLHGKRYLIESLVDYSAQKDIQEKLTKANNKLRMEIGKREAMEDELKWIAYRDPLTSLPNRISFFDQLDQAVQAAQQAEGRLAVMFIDLDRFKMINDTAGHMVGDQLLIAVADRLVDNLRDEDVIARFGGDEFAVMLNDIACQGMLETIVEPLLKSFQQPFKIKDQIFFVTPSIGLSLYPEDGGDAETLLKIADIAMYKAKDMGRNQWSFCTESVKNDIAEWMLLSTQLHHALERNEFVLYYQPQIDCNSHSMSGVEALIRWNHPEQGIISPGKFIPIAEQTGMIHSIGEWVLRTACRQMKVWQKAGLPPIKVAVNLSAVQINNPRIVQQVTDILQETGLAPEFLELEITESVTINEINSVVHTLHSFKEKGVLLSIDDFGTDYSSLSYLKQLPIDKIKIAMPFVQGIGVNEKDEAITKTIVVLGKSLGLKVIAEGVETERQLAFLQQQACDEIQGYYYYKPMPADELESILQQ